MDQRLRDLERRAQSGDPQSIATYLHALIHAGSYAIEDTKLLAWLGYTPAQILHPTLFNKKGKLATIQGREVLLHVMQRVFMATLAESPSLSAIYGSELDGYRILRSFIRDLIENFESRKLPASQQDMMRALAVDIFQRRAIAALQDSLGFSVSIQDIEWRVRAACNEIINSAACPFYQLTVPKNLNNLIPRPERVPQRVLEPFLSI